MHARLSDILADMRFRTTVELGGKTATGLPVPDAAAGAAAGDQVDVHIALDTAPREVIAPTDLADALANDDEARQFSDTLAYTHRKEWVRWIEEAKKADTRRARIAKATEALHAGRRTR